MKIVVNVIGLGAGLADLLERCGFEVIRYNPAAKDSVRPKGPIVNYEWLD